MTKVPADLHIHIDNNLNKEQVIKILKAAEVNGLKAICILEHNSLNFYKRGGILEELLIEGIEQYYTGKIISGVELNCTIKQAPVSSTTGIDYNGYDMHILMYGFNPSELRKKVDWFDEEVDATRYYSDVDTLLSKLAELNLPLPPKSYFKFAEGVKPFKQLYKYIESSPDKQLYVDALGEYPHPSSFVRHLAYSPTSKIYFDRAQSPSIVDVINVGKEYASLLCVAYPYHINRKLISDVTDYIDTLQSIPSKTNERNFNAVEGPYMLNTDDETGEIIHYAKNHNMLYTAGSDYQPQDKMYYLPPEATEKIWYAPAPGLYIRQLFDGGMGLLTVEEELLNVLPDVRDYNVYRTQTSNEVEVEQKPINNVVEEKQAIEEEFDETENAYTAEGTSSIASVEENSNEEVSTSEYTYTNSETGMVEKVEELPTAEELQSPTIEEVAPKPINLPEDNSISSAIADDDDDNSQQKPIEEYYEEPDANYSDSKKYDDEEEYDEEEYDGEEIENNEYSNEEYTGEEYVEEYDEPTQPEYENEEAEETEEVVETPVQPPVQKVPAKKPTKKVPAKKPAPTKAPAKKSNTKKQAKAEMADALDDTMAMLEKLTNDLQ